jgi:diadenosine tetraphosphate (Ap4A) HIT family hydrolase
MGDACLVCREVAGEIELPGGLLWDDEHVVAFHLPPIDENVQPYLGHCLVVTRRHVDHLGDLTIAEAESVARASRAVATGLQAEGAERVHLAVIGLGVDHFHQHLFPRYPGVPPGTPWTALDELPAAPHGGAQEISALVERLRRHLPVDSLAEDEKGGHSIGQARHHPTST